MNDLKGILLLVLLMTTSIASTNIDCNGKAFHCVNSTHFIICVDLGRGISITIDDFVIPCPPPTLCQPDNRFECEFPKTTTSRPLEVVGVTTREAITESVGVISLSETSENKDLRKHDEITKNTATTGQTTVSETETSIRYESSTIPFRETLVPTTTMIPIIDFMPLLNLEVLESDKSNSFLEKGVESTTERFSDNINPINENDEVIANVRVKATHESIFSPPQMFFNVDTISGNKLDNTSKMNISVTEMLHDNSVAEKGKHNTTHTTTQGSIISSFVDAQISKNGTDYLTSTILDIATTPPSTNGATIVANYTNIHEITEGVENTRNEYTSANKSFVIDNRTPTPGIKFSAVQSLNLFVHEKNTAEQGQQSNFNTHQGTNGHNATIPYNDILVTEIITTNQDPIIITTDRISIRDPSIIGDQKNASTWDFSTTTTSVPVETAKDNIVKEKKSAAKLTVQGKVYNNSGIIKDMLSTQSENLSDLSNVLKENSRGQDTLVEKKSIIEQVLTTTEQYLSVSTNHLENVREALYTKRDNISNVLHDVYLTTDIMTVFDDALVTTESPFRNNGSQASDLSTVVDVQNNATKIRNTGVLNNIQKVWNEKNHSSIETNTTIDQPILVATTESMINFSPDIPNNDEQISRSNLDLPTLDINLKKNSTPTFKDNGHASNKTDFLSKMEAFRTDNNLNAVSTTVSYIDDSYKNYNFLKVSSGYQSDFDNLQKELQNNEKAYNNGQNINNSEQSLSQKGYESLVNFSNTSLITTVKLYDTNLNTNTAATMESLSTGNSVTTNILNSETTPATFSQGYIEISQSIQGNQSELNHSKELFHNIDAYNSTNTIKTGNELFVTLPTSENLLRENTFLTNDYVSNTPTENAYVTSLPHKGYTNEETLSNIKNVATTVTPFTHTVPITDIFIPDHNIDNHLIMNPKIESTTTYQAKEEMYTESQLTNGTLREINTTVQVPFASSTESFVVYSSNSNLKYDQTSFPTSYTSKDPETTLTELSFVNYGIPATSTESMLSSHNQVQENSTNDLNDTVSNNIIQNEVNSKSIEIKNAIDTSINETKTTEFLLTTTSSISQNTKAGEQNLFDALIRSTTASHPYTFEQTTGKYENTKENLFVNNLTPSDKVLFNKQDSNNSLTELKNGNSLYDFQYDQSYQMPSINFTALHNSNVNILSQIDSPKTTQSVNIENNANGFVYRILTNPSSTTIYSQTEGKTKDFTTSFNSDIKNTPSIQPQTSNITSSSVDINLFVNISRTNTSNNMIGENKENNDVTRDTSEITLFHKIVGGTITNEENLINTPHKDETSTNIIGTTVNNTDNGKMDTDIITENPIYVLSENKFSVDIQPSFHENKTGDEVRQALKTGFYQMSLHDYLVGDFTTKNDSGIERKTNNTNVMAELSGAVNGNDSKSYKDVIILLPEVAILDAELTINNSVTVSPETPTNKTVLLNDPPKATETTLVNTYIPDLDLSLKSHLNTPESNFSLPSTDSINIDRKIGFDVHTNKTILKDDYYNNSQLNLTEKNMKSVNTLPGEGTESNSLYFISNKPSTLQTISEDVTSDNRSINHNMKLNVSGIQILRNDVIPSNALLVTKGLNLDVQESLGMHLTTEQPFNSTTEYNVTEHVSNSPSTNSIEAVVTQNFVPMSHITSNYTLGLQKLKTVDNYNEKNSTNTELPNSNQLTNTNVSLTQSYKTVTKVKSNKTIITDNITNATNFYTDSSLNSIPNNNITVYQKSKHIISKNNILVPIYFTNSNTSIVNNNVTRNVHDYISNVQNIPSEHVRQDWVQTSVHSEIENDVNRVTNDTFGGKGNDSVTENSVRITSVDTVIEQHSPIYMTPTKANANVDTDTDVALAGKIGVHLSEQKYTKTNGVTILNNNTKTGLNFNSNILQYRNRSVSEKDEKIKSSNYTAKININEAINTTKDDIEVKNNNTEINKNMTDNNRGLTVNISNFDCWNRIRGRYADNKDCRRFYICIGRPQPMIGTCPINTVFSDINKQCTRNLSHCVRNNQFRCLQEGRFSDFFSDNIYYICVKNGMNTFLRFKLQCQRGYHLNKVSVKCEQHTDISSLSVSSVSENSQKDNESKSKNNQESSSPDFECKKEGKFPDSDDCRKYYVCYKNNKSEFRRKIKYCDSDEVFQKDKKKCVENKSDEC